MKNYKKFIVGILCALFILASSLFAVFADTIYVVNGYSFTLVKADSISICGWDDSSSVFSVPSEIAEKKVISIANYGLTNDTEITELDFSNAKNLTRIGMCAFEGCSNISNNVVIPNTVTRINESAFKDCSSLSDVTISNQLSKIEYGVFRNCSSLKSIIIPESVQSIDHYAFENCTSLEYVEISPQTTDISNVAFKNIGNLILGVWCDSYAHQYAVENRIDHKILDRQLGDVNFDGAVDVFDATEIQKYAAEKVEFSNEQFDMGDINHDGYVDVMDALLVQKSVVGKYDIPPVIIRY